MNTISATELTRNTREILDRVVTRGEIVTIERNHTMVAQLMPPQQGSSWLQDSKDGFGDTVRNARA